MDRTGTSQACIRLAWALAATTTIGLAGCGGKTSDETVPGDQSIAKASADAKAGGKPRIVIVTNGNSDWWSAVEKGMKDGGERFGADVEMKRSDGSTERQISLIEEALSIADVKGLAISVVEADAPGIADAIRKVKDAGKVVITIDSDIAPSQAEVRRAYIGTNNTKAGETAGKAAAALRPQGGTVAAYVGTAAAANARERIDGFFAGAGPKFLKPPVEIFEDQADANKAESLAELSISKHPDIDVMLGIYSYNGPRIAAQAAKVPEFRKKVTIVSFDLDEQLVDHLEKGNVDVTVCQNPYEIGYQAVRLLKAIVADDKKTVEEMLPAGKDIVDIPVRVVVPSDASPVKGKDVITIKAMKEWLASKGLKSS